MKRRLYIILVSVVLAFLLVVIFVVMMKYGGAGSNQYSEDYLVYGAYDSVIKKIRQVQDTNGWNRTNSYQDKLNEFDYEAYVYVHRENKIYLTLIRPRSQDITAVSLVSTIGITDRDADLKKVKLINRDYDRKHNDKIKQSFQEEVFKKMGVNFEDKGNSMKVFGIQF